MLEEEDKEMPEEDNEMPEEDERMPHKRSGPGDSDPEMIPDNSKGQKSANSESDSGSSAELIEDKPDRGLRPRSRAWSVPRRLRGKQKILEDVRNQPHLHTIAQFY